MKTPAKSAQANRHDVLHTTLVALRDETYERVRELRREQQDDTEPVPADGIDRAHASVDVETHASLIARAEERRGFATLLQCQLAHAGEIGSQVNFLAGDPDPLRTRAESPIRCRRSGF
jgi:hypothetical protein